MTAPAVDAKPLLEHGVLNCLFFHAVRLSLKPDANQLGICPARGGGPSLRFGRGFPKNTSLMPLFSEAKSQDATEKIATSDTALQRAGLCELVGEESPAQPMSHQCLFLHERVLPELARMFEIQSPN